MAEAKEIQPDRSREEIEAEYDKRTKTKAGEYRATARGYAGGMIIDPPNLVPEGVPVSTEWMEKVGKASGSAALQRAVDDAQAPRKDDPALEELSIGALQALATDAGVTSVKGLSKADLITAIRAADEQRRG